MSHYRPISERIKDYKPVELRLSDEEIKKELKRCQDCGIPFCHALGCPLGNVIPEINQDALNGRWDTALARLLETSPFPEFTARVCPALCEGSCVQALDGEPVPTRLAEYEVIERGFARGWIKAIKPKKKLNLDLGIIGSGPAGLTVAQTLIRAGAQVTVYEKDQKPGGFLRYGIPDFKLEKSIIDRRLDLMAQEGVIFLTGLEAGTDISVRLLKKRHDLLVMALGSRQKRDLPIPGRSLQGVHFATDYLSAQNRLVGGELSALPPELNAQGRKVVVIGGGDTGSDCVGTAWRQGASEVTQLEILPKPPEKRALDNPWPQWPRILRTTSSHQEGGQRRWAVTTHEFLPNKNNPNQLGALRCQEVNWIAEPNRPLSPVPVPGTEFSLQADLVLLAMGFVSPEFGNLSSPEAFKPDPQGRLSERLYAAGDAVTGPSLVVRAMDSALKLSAVILSDHGGKLAQNQPAQGQSLSGQASQVSTQHLVA
ncbi:MAG: glutamate synthase subunit beta [Deltaproteobacteria bacterium]|jgi:glutamate synthase (NADPH/NADH) small chain|nr:glutamate synthase subunit beta [Deltaproteobacteria bacterium]